VTHHPFPTLELIFPISLAFWNQSFLQRDFCGERKFTLQTSFPTAIVVSLMFVPQQAQSSSPRAPRFFPAGPSYHENFFFS